MRQEENTNGSNGRLQLPRAAVFSPMVSDAVDVRFNQPVNINLSVLIDKSIEKHNSGWCRSFPHSLESSRQKQRCCVVPKREKPVARDTAKTTSALPVSTAKPNEWKGHTTNQSPSPDGVERSPKKKKPSVMKRVINEYSFSSLPIVGTSTL